MDDDNKPTWKVSSKLRSNARALRRDSTDAERILWSELRDHRLNTKAVGTLPAAEDPPVDTGEQGGNRQSLAAKFSPLVAAALGVVYLIGRELYAYTYVKDPGKREVGYGMTFLPMVILVVGGLVGAVRALFFT